MKNCIGFDIGNHAIHIAVRKNRSVVRGETVRLDGDLVKNGVIASYDKMAEFLGSLRRTLKAGTANAALVLPAPLCYCRRFFVTANTREQLLFNLPYGFRDFIADDKSNYFFDCAVLGTVQSEGRPPEVDVLATAARKEIVAEYIAMFRKAGFRLKTMIPEEFAYVNLLRRAQGEPHTHGVLDIGHNAVKLFLFRGSLFESVRVIDYGCNALDAVISEQFGVSAFTAATYREKNTEGANELEGCRAIYGAMALEVLKAINFYRFNGGGSPAHLHCCGGGSKNAALMEALAETLPVPLTDMSEFYGEGGSGEGANFPLVAAAAGAALQ